MGKRQRQWAARTRADLVAKLGSICQNCGEPNLEKLQLDISESLVDKYAGDKHHKIEWSHRISYYKKHMVLDNLNLLCDKCNSKKGNIERAKSQKAKAVKPTK